MQRFIKRTWAWWLGGVAALALLAVPLTASAQGDVLGKILKAGGVALVIDRFGDDIDRFINNLMQNNGVPTEEATKVVPVLTLGSGGYAGAAQVGGPQDRVERVEAVVQLEGEFRGNSIRARALVPVDSTDISKPEDINKVRGVGLTALIDIEL